MDYSFSGVTLGSRKETDQVYAYGPQYISKILSPMKLQCFGKKYKEKKLVKKLPPKFVPHKVVLKIAMNVMR